MSGGQESEHHGHPRVTNQQQGRREDGTEDGAEAPVVFGWQVTATVVNRAWTRTVGVMIPITPKEVTISRTNTSIFMPGMVEAIVSIAGSSAVVCAVVLANR